MVLSNLSDKPIGVIGAGNFGSTIANILADRYDVLLYTRHKKRVEKILKDRKNKSPVFTDRVTPTNDIEYLTNRCDIIFPIVPSAFFRTMMKRLAPFLHPYHILIHGTKGLDIQLPEGETLETIKILNRDSVKTMSEVIREESVVLRIGCLSGPNLSKELAQQQPSATVVASSFQEVIQIGKKLLRRDWFQVYENNDLIGVEMAGVLKNIIAIAAGALSGLGYGENSKGLLISRGAVEMIYLGKALGANIKAFLGVAGIGDLVTTCNSSMSRNFTIGFRLAQGETIKQIIHDTKEVAEGINTVRIIKKCADYYKVRAPITDRLYEVLFEHMTIQEALEYLMRYPFNIDIDFLE